MTVRIGLFMAAAAPFVPAADAAVGEASLPREAENAAKAAILMSYLSLPVPTAAPWPVGGSKDGRFSSPGGHG
jgi:hypothetical protein